MIFLAYFAAINAIVAAGTIGLVHINLTQWLLLYTGIFGTMLYYSLLALGTFALILHHLHGDFPV